MGNEKMRHVFFLIPFLLILLIPFWVDPDATGTYNTICGNSQVEIPTISLAILSAIPCSILAWKIFHLLLLLLILWVFSKEYSLSIFGVVGFATVFLLTLEDDLIAFLPILVFGIWVLTNSKQRQESLIEEKSKRSLQRLLLLVGSILFLFLGLFVWKGAFLIMGILLAYLIKPQLSLIPAIAYILYSYGNDWGNASEKIIGAGWIIGQIGLFLLLYFIYKEYKTGTFRFKLEYYLLLSLEILAFFEPKWGEWLIIPLAFLLEPYFDKSERLRFFGIWMIVLTIIFSVLTSFPSHGESLIINNAVEYQKQGKIVLNDWGVGHYFEFYGGKPSQKGGYAGFQDVNGYYWLGPDKNCETISSSNTLFFQKC